MQIVIDISESRYEHLKGGKIQHGSIAEFQILKAVKNGIVLPKGHGRLIDEERISLSGIHFKTERDHAMMIGRLNSAITLIEADKGE